VVTEIAYWIADVADMAVEALRDASVCPETSNTCISLSTITSTDLSTMQKEEILDELGLRPIITPAIIENGFRAVFGGERR
jgi:hypothetical protein